jgi:hypothetical protein
MCHQASMEWFMERVLIHYANVLFTHEWKFIKPKLSRITFNSFFLPHFKPADLKKF